MKPARFTSNSDLLIKLENIEARLAAVEEIPMTLAHTSQMLGIPEKRLREMANRMEIPNYKVGTSIFFYLSEVNAWIRAGRSVNTFLTLKRKAV